eukprot:6195949-Pleurochrysis_carterae.AAC.3
MPRGARTSGRAEGTAAAVLLAHGRATHALAAQPAGLRSRAGPAEDVSAVQTWVDERHSEFGLAVKQLDFPCEQLQRDQLRRQREWKLSQHRRRRRWHACPLSSYFSARCS